MGVARQLRRSNRPSAVAAPPAQSRPGRVGKSSRSECMRTCEPVSFEFWLLASGPHKSEAHVSQLRAEGRLPRIARLMALAIRFDGLMRSGVIRDYADLARL